VRLRMAFGPRLLLRGRSRLGLRSGSELGLGIWAVLGLRSGALHRLRTGLWRGLRCRTVLRLRRRLRLGLGCGTVLRLNRTVLRLLGAELRLLRPGLRLDRPRLLGLDRAGVGLLRLNGANLLWGRPVVRLELWLSGPVVRVHGSGLGQARSHFGWNGSDLGLSWTRRGLTRC